MSQGFKTYIIECLAFAACAAGVTIFVCLKIPTTPNAWSQIVWFVLVAVPAELMAVYVNEEKGVFISPAYAIHWAAVCVLGPVPAIVYVVIMGILVTTIRYASIVIVNFLDSKSTLNPPENDLSAIGKHQNRMMRSIEMLLRDIAKLLSYLEPRWLILFFGLYTISGMVLFVGAAGIAYYYAGGHFLISTTQDYSFIINFILPFIALVIVSIAIDMLGTLATILVLFAEEKAPIRETILKIKLTAAEIFPPLVGPQLFSAVVGLSLAYLYVHLHLLGFAVAAAPVVTLRHFFSQWVAERDAYVGTITTLATYMQHYHPYTRGHLKRVADLSERLARELRLPVESIRFIGTAGMLHDIGKIGVSEQILDKTEKLTDEEWEKIKEHPVKGAEIISHLEFLDGIVDWVKYHHKWYNGAGYPTTNGNGTQLPMEALIIATADAFDAMTDDRELTLNWKCDSCGYTPTDDERPDTCPQCGAQKRRTYRQPKTLDGAIEELRRGAGSQFHPAVVKAFLTMIERDGVKTNV
jgi:putative nucleotidyltransferase with HDIG domain